jgi:hypothetical protein
MKINLPEQNKPAAGAVPSQPRKLKKVLGELPNANMGELTRQTFTILRDLNRQTMSNRDRLEDMEMIRVMARSIFDNLKKYFINRTLPLPEKSQKIVNLNQSILRELIYGYEIIAYEASNRIDTRIDDRTLATAICRSINYLSEMYLRCCEVYVPCPSSIWLEANQLYAYAESRNLVDFKVSNDEHGGSDITIAIAYKQLMLFNLARPISLRQRDSERLYKELFDWAQYTDISRDINESGVDKMFVIHIDNALPPNYLRKTDIAQGGNMRTIDARRLVEHVVALRQKQIDEKKEVAIGDVIGIETLTALINAWSVSAKRRFQRADRDGRLTVSIGLSPAVKAIRDSYRKDNKRESVDSRSGLVRTSTSIRQDPDFTLEAIQTHQDSGLQGYMTHTEINSGENNSWDMVAKGRVLTETYDKEQQMLNDERTRLHKDKEDSHWEVVNISAGGYCLRWNSDDTSRAQIGELIAIQEFDAAGKFAWRTGVIRWMQFTRENGLEIGVQVISPKVATATVQRINRPNELPFDCLLLPGIKALKQPPSIILPSHAFASGDKLTVNHLEKKHNITLGEIGEHTGSFTQFTYRHTEDVQQHQKRIKKEEANKSKDDFDELWSSL